MILRWKSLILLGLLSCTFYSIIAIRKTQVDVTMMRLAVEYRHNLISMATDHQAARLHYRAYKEAKLSAESPEEREEYLSANPLPYLCLVSKETNQEKAGKRRLVLAAGVYLPESKEKGEEIIYENLLLSIKSLEPEVKVVVFVDEESKWEKRAKELSLTVSEPDLNRFGAPLSGHMMTFLEKTFDADFYGLIDSQILLSQEITKTLDVLREQACANVFPPNKILVIGKRKNFKVTPEDMVPDLASFKEKFMAFKKKSKNYGREGINFLIMTKGLFNWEDPSNFPDYVLTRPFFMNGVLLMALKTGATIVDISGTVSALFQMEKSGEGGITPAKASYNDFNWNIVIPHPMGINEKSLKDVHTGQAHFITYVEANTYKVAKTENDPPQSLFPFASDQSK